MAKILIIEDETDLLEQYQEILAADGHKVTGFSNGEKALDCFEDEFFDLVITDLHLPGISGKHLIKSLQHNSTNPNCPMIIISGHLTELKMASKGLAFGRLHFLAKPFRVEIFRMKVQQALEQDKRQSIVGSKFLEEVISSTEHCLSAMFSVAVTHEKPHQKQKGEVNGDISAVANAISADFTGIVALSMTNDNFSKVVGHMIGVDPGAVDMEMRDAVAELLNTIFGRVKQTMNEQGSDFRSEIPSIIMGNNHCVEFRSAFVSLVIPFQCAGLGQVKIEISAIS